MTLNQHQRFVTNDFGSYLDANTKLELEKLTSLMFFAKDNGIKCFICSKVPNIINLWLNNFK